MPWTELPPALAEQMEDQLQRFIEKFGREPGPNDPIFFDPDFDEPTPLDPAKMFAETVITMIKAGTPRNLIYAFIRTDGMLLGNENQDKWSKEDLALWDLAMDEYEDTFGDEDD